MIDLGETSFEEHLSDLRQALIRILVVVVIGFCLNFAFYQQLYSLFLTPLLGRELLIFSPLEGLNTTFKLAFWMGLVTTSPIWIMLVLNFVLPALYPHEKRRTLPITLLSFLFLSAGFAFGLFVVLPLANNYLEAFNNTIGKNMWGLTHYLDYSVILILSSGLCFELALILLLLVHYGALSAKWMRGKRRHAIVLAFILGAVLTPPDIFTQLLIAAPLVILYEVAILYAKFKSR